MRILDLYAICKTMLRTSFDEHVKDKEHVLITRRRPPDNIQGSCPFTSFFECMPSYWEPHQPTH